MRANNDRILVEVEYEETIGVGMLIIPDAAKERVMDFWGKVISVGPECPHDLKVGDKVIFERNEGNLIEESKGKKILSLKPDRVLAVLNDGV